jgi:V/A-type H+-transporting ATPase subunit D
MLDRKQRILAEEHARLELAAANAAAEWVLRAREAKTWLTRAAALDGADRLREAEPVGRAEVHIIWGATLGVEHPLEAPCSIPHDEPSGGGSSLRECALCHAAAVRAAAASAAANRAVRLVGNELVATRRRQRVLERRRVPRLESGLAEAHQQMEQQELEESLRTRWSAGAHRGAT